MKNKGKKNGFIPIKPRFDRGNSGFTLIELLVVIAVVGVLAGAVIAIINPNAQFARARDAKRKVDLKQIRSALGRYKIVNGTYPVMGKWALSTTSNWIPLLVSSGELRSVPVDPTSSGCASGYPWNGGNTCWVYAYWSDGNIYDLVAQLENTQDPDRCAVKQWFYFGDNHVWCTLYSIQVYAPGPDQ